ncbi:hypothetical protein BH10PSE4_BH10PSE4_33890 [soil metagenome]
MLRAAATIAIVLSLAAAPSAMAEDKPLGWFATSVRSVFLFHSCTERLKEKFKIGPLTGLEVTDMETDAKRADGAMDVRFEAVTTEKKTARKTRFAGVCHVGPEGETRIDARLVSQSGGDIRRISPAKAG